MATQGMSPIERLAKGLVKPVAVKQTTPPPTPGGLDDLLASKTAVPTTTIAPIKTGGSDPNPPVLPAYSVPANKPFVGPTLDAEVVAARRKLEGTSKSALAQGVDPATVQSIQTGQGDPDRGFKKPARFLGNILKNIYSLDLQPGEGTKQPFVAIANQPLASLPTKSGQKDLSIKSLGSGGATLGVKALVAASPALNKLDFFRRIITSTVQETGDAFGGRGFSGSDWVNQLSADKGVTGGDLFKNVGNIPYIGAYADQILGFGADIFLDPVTWATGPGGLGKTAAQKAALTAGKTGGRSAQLAVRASKAQADQFAASLQKELAEEALNNAISIGDDVAAKAAEDIIKQANDLSASAAKVLSGDATTRTLGRTSNQALAENVLGVRDDAQKVIDRYADEFGITPADTITQIQAKGLIPKRLDPMGYGARRGAASLEELANARRVVDALNDGVIKNIQTSGLAGILPPLKEIYKGRPVVGELDRLKEVLKGTRTEAQDVLGVRGGVRVINPLQIFPTGIGPQRFTIPGTENLLNATGLLLSRSRLKVGNTALGATFLNKITPTGEGGLYGSEDLLRMRTSLRSGNLSAQEATDITRQLAIDQQYRALVNNERKVAAGYLARSDIKQLVKDNPKILNEVLEIRDVARAAGIPPVYNTAQDAASKAMDKLFADFYDYAAKASGATGFVPPKRIDYFPQMQSDKALRWAKANPQEAEKLAKALNVDRTWFVGNFRARELAAGDTFFGKTLTDDDIAGGVTALNSIAKASGVIDFDFFESDVLQAINKYAQKHAQFSALQKTIGSLPENLPSQAARVVGTKTFVQPRARGPLLVNEFMSDFFDESGEFALDTAKVLETLTSGELKTLIDDVETLSSKLDAKLVDKPAVQKSVNDLKLRLQTIEDGYNAKTIDETTAAVATDAVKLEAATLADDLKNVSLNIMSVPVNRWSDYSKIVKKGFEVLNDSFTDPATGKFYQGTAPNIAVTEELADLLRNAQRMDDKAFASKVRQLSEDYTRFSKAWLTARPGFHTRNALSNTFQLVAAGADPVNLQQANRILFRVNQGLKQGLTPREIAEKVVDSNLVKGTVEEFDPVLTTLSRRQLVEAVEDAINYSGSTGFGQFGEIAAEVGIGNRGVLQRNQVGTVKLKDPSTYKSIPSRTAGGYLKGSRKAGEKIENYSRFGLMWDGIMKGLSPQEAVARSNKFLIDYSDLSKLDRNARLIIPFWTFMSRNTPLQLELMWTNPKAYAVYSNFKRNFEDDRTEEEGGLVIPSYEKDRGVFAIKNPIFGQDVIRPGLPFPGGGENVIKNIVNSPLTFFANVNPILRAPIEATLDKKFFTGGKVVPKEWKDKPFGEQLKYVVKEILTPASPLVAYLKAIPFVGRQEFMEDIFGITVDEAEPLVQEVNGLLSLLGLPIGKQRTASSVKEIENRIYKLADKIEGIKNRARDKREEEIEKQKANPPKIAPTTGTGGLDDLLSGTTTTP